MSICRWVAVRPRVCEGQHAIYNLEPCRREDIPVIEVGSDAFGMQARALVCDEESDARGTGAYRVRRSRAGNVG
jgi:hypothetical protein